MKVYGEGSYGRIEASEVWEIDWANPICHGYQNCCVCAACQIRAKCHEARQKRRRELSWLAQRAEASQAAASALSAKPRSAT